MKRLLFGVVVFSVVGCSDDGAPVTEFPDPTPVVMEAEGLPPFPDVPMTEEGIELGRKLFHDSILSADRTQSCSSCHNQPQAFSDSGKQFSEGVTGDLGDRNASVIVNPAWGKTFFWDGRAESLEDQARGPVPNPIEMNLPWPEAIARLTAHNEYPELFARAFGSYEVTEDRVVEAIAMFERTFISNNSKWDRVQRGEATFTEQETRGEALFFSEQAQCFHCHGTTLFTDHDFHDNGLDEVPVDAGRFKVTEAEIDRGKFLTPTLRNAAVSGPYMHDGRFQTLAEVVDHYADGVKRSPNLSASLRLNAEPGVRLTQEERSDLLAFLHTLTDQAFLTTQMHSAVSPNP